MKKLILSIFILLALFIIPSKIEAQGTYGCHRPNIMGGCELIHNNCTGGAIPGECPAAYRDCQVELPCIVVPTPTPTLPPVEENPCHQYQSPNTCPSSKCQWADRGIYGNSECLGENLPMNTSCNTNSECESKKCIVTIPGGIYQDPIEKRCANSQGTFIPENQLPSTLKPYNPCSNFSGGARTSCEHCHEDKGAWTAFGCIPTQPTQFAGSFISILFGIAGGVAFLLMIYGAFLCITSQGNPQKTQACKETITAAIVGLLLLIFSLIIISALFEGPMSLIPGFIGTFD